MPAGKKLLVADDSLTIQKVIRLALSSEGYEIHAVSDGNEALQQISLFRPDVVLVDVSLPGKSAFEIKGAANAHADLRGVRFVLMSNAFESVDEIEAARVFFDGRLTKPFDPAHLRQVLSDVLGTGAREGALPPRMPKLPAEPPPLPHSLEESEGPILDIRKHLTPPPPAPPAPPTFGELPDDIRGLTESTIKMTGLDDFEWSVNEPVLKPHPRMIDEDEHEAPAFSPPVTAGAAATVNPAEMEEIVRRQLQESLEQAIRKLLPDIAERVVKQEIHRMLAERV